jgi:hypothetical protein
MDTMTALPMPLVTTNWVRSPVAVTLDLLAREPRALEWMSVPKILSLATIIRRVLTSNRPFFVRVTLGGSLTPTRIQLAVISTSVLGMPTVATLAPAVSIARVRLSVRVTLGFRALAKCAPISTNVHFPMTYATTARRALTRVVRIGAFATLGL